LAEAGVAGAEVVEQDADPEVAQLLQYVLRQCRVGDDGCLGDFELQQLGGDVMGGEEFGDLLGQVVVGQVAGGNVHRDRQGPPRPGPDGGPGQGRVQDVAGEWADQPGVLGEGDERVG